MFESIVGDRICGCHVCSMCCSGDVAAARPDCGKDPKHLEHGQHIASSEPTIRCCAQSCESDQASILFGSCEHDRLVQMPPVAKQRRCIVSASSRCVRACATCGQFRGWQVRTLQLTGQHCPGVPNPISEFGSDGMGASGWL